MAFTLQINQPAPDFELPGVDDKRYSLANFAGAPVLVVAFWCNHCPYVVGSEDRMKKFVADYAPRGVRVIAINANETENHPDDSFEKMIERARRQQYNFPYLRDETQEVARAYGALRTPHFFVFDQDRKLIYTGRGVDNPRETSKMTTNDLARALEEHLAGKPVSTPLTNPIGCNVKWDGKDAHWMPPDACDLV